MDQPVVLENKFIPAIAEDDNIEKGGVSEAENPGHDNVEGGVSEVENPGHDNVDGGVSDTENPGHDNVEGGGVRGNRRFPGDDTLFTRYLYIKRQVMQSLFIALIDKNREEALFWGYELYYSGFQTETLEFIESIYGTIYKPCCSSSFTDFFQSKYSEWKEDNTKDFIVGVLLWNLSIRQYDINYFIEQFFNVKCVKKPVVQNKQFRITMLDIEKYKTQEYIIGKGRFILPNQCRYKIHNEVDELFKTDLIDIKKKFQYHWDYYAYECPIWQERILNHNGKKNDETHRIDFSDDDSEDFYDLYGYEPDEQSLEVQERCIGSQAIKQMTVKELSKKYGGTIICKFIKRNK